MKKLILLAGLYCLQPSLHAAPGKPNFKYDKAPISARERALTHFKENYAWVQDAAWFTGADQSMYCIFHQGNILNRVFYDLRGYWKYTLLSYPPSDLPRSVRERVLNSFEGYKVFYVNEVRSDGQEPVYMVNIENEDNIKVIEVKGDEISVSQSLIKR